MSRKHDNLNADAMGKWVADELRQGNLTLAQVAGLTEEELASVEEAGHLFRRMGHLQRACETFCLLIGFAPYNPRYWRAVAGLKQRLGQPGHALLCYEILATLEDRQAESTYREATCLEQLGGDDVARELMQEALSLVAPGEEPSWKTHAQRVLARG
jgi:hypothetical protein